MPPPIAFKKMASRMDFSNYRTDDPLFSTENENVLGCFKNESSGREIKKIVALKAKLYRIEYFDSTDFKMATRGLSRKDADRKLSMHDFETCLNSGLTSDVTTRRIVGKRFALSTCVEKKSSLSSIETKRVFLSCGIHSRAHGNIRNASVICPECAPRE